MVYNMRDQLIVTSDVVIICSHTTKNLIYG